MNPEEQIFGLIAAAEEQQKLVNAAISGLKRERIELSNMTTTVAQSTKEAVTLAMRESLSMATEQANQSIGDAVKPVINRLASVVEAANGAESSLKRASAWFAWKWVAVITAAVAGLCLVVYGSLTYQRFQVNELWREKSTLLADIEQLQIRADRLAKQGAKIEISDCKGRLCIAVDNINVQENHIFYVDGDTRKKAFVIPKGY